MFSKYKHLIHPFNLSQSEYERMFQQVPPSNLGVAICTYEAEPFSGEACSALWYKIEAAVKTLNKLAGDFPETAQHLAAANTANVKWESSHCIWREKHLPDLSAQQREWVFDGIYLQVAFCTQDALQDDILRKCANLGMMFLDQWVGETDSTEPTSHIPQAVSASDETAYNKLIGDTFRSGDAIWARELVSLRNKWLIMLRALMEWKDPFEEWDRFVQAGGSYFLDYPALCLHSTTPGALGMTNVSSASGAASPTSPKVVIDPSVRDIILPFNLPSAGYETMFAETPPDDLQGMCILLNTPDMSYRSAEKRYEKRADELVDVEKKLVQAATELGIPSKINFSFNLNFSPKILWHALDSLQRKWLVDGIYLQVGFRNRSLTDEHLVDRDIAVAMTFLDYMANRAKSPEPANHKPLLVPAENARDYRLAINGLYEERVGIWCKQLLEYRNMAMVMFRAALAGDDPAVEYDRYAKSQPVYCMDYCSLIP